MSATFNPYREWPGIPDNGQPLNYYRLLGLTIFESNPATIERAVQYRLARIESVASPERAAAAQAIAGEIILARNFLLSPASKEAYDRGLQASASAPPVAVVARPSEPTVVAGPAAPRPAAKSANLENGATRTNGPPLWRQPLIILSSAAALTIVIGLALMVRTTEETDDQRDSVVTRNNIEREFAPAAKRRVTQSSVPAEVRSKTKRRELVSQATSNKSAEEATNETSAVATGFEHAAARAGGAEPRTPEAGLAVGGSATGGADNADAAQTVVSTTSLPDSSSAAPADPKSDSPGTAESSADKARPAQFWLRTNESGEPYDVTLADGTVLKLDTYGDEYEGHEYRAPMPAAKGDILIDYRRLRWYGLFGGGIKLDLKHRKMYWGDTLRGPHPSSIRRANLDGSPIETVIDRDRLRPSDFILDVDDSMIFWVNAGLVNGDGRSIERANFAGSQRKVIVEPISVTGGIAIDAKERHLYYVDGDSLIRCDLDGSNQTRILATRKPGTLLIDTASRTIYWTKNMHMIRKAGLDGHGECDAVNIGESHGHITRAALDAKAGKLYWTHSNPGRIQRSNLDGSQIEDVVVGEVTFSGLDIDAANGHMYWTENFPDARGEPVTLVRRTSLVPSRIRLNKIFELQRAKQKRSHAPTVC